MLPALSLRVHDSAAYKDVKPTNIASVEAEDETEEECCTIGDNRWYEFWKYCDGSGYFCCFFCVGLIFVFSLIVYLNVTADEETLNSLCSGAACEPLLLARHALGLGPGNQPHA